LTVTNPSPANSGTYKIRVRIPGCNNIWVEYERFINVAPRELWWNEHPEDNNWNNGGNWLNALGDVANAIPVECTKVHIPSVADMYPILDMVHTPRNPGMPVCDTIIYHFGSETTFPNYLTYRRAFIHYNMGYYSDTPNNYYEGQPWENAENNYPAHDFFFELPVLERGRWYTLATPLKDIVAGDFGLAGYPKLWQRVYNLTNPENNAPASGDFSTEIRMNNMKTYDISNNSIALWIADYRTTGIGFDDQKNLEGLKGIIELPYINSAQVAPYRPLHTYKVVGSDTLSIFQRFYDDDLTIADEWDTIARGFQSHRFIFENYKNGIEEMTYNGSRIHIYKQTIKQQGRTMIGNPFMSQLDFDKFYEFNSGLISDYYEIYDGTSSSFKHYRYQSGAGTDPELSNAIAPLQGFVINVTAAAPVTLVYPMSNTTTDDIAVFAYDKDWGLDLNNKPRVQRKYADNEGHLRLTAITPPRKVVGRPKKGKDTNDTIRVSATLMFNSPLEAINKVVFPEDLKYKAELFFMHDDGSVNVDQVENDHPETVRLGYQSTYPGTIKLAYEKTGMLKNGQVWIKDEFTGKEVELSGESGHYSFTNYSVIVNDTVGLHTDRFTLRFKYPDVGVSESQYELKTYVDKQNTLHVHSSEYLSTVKVLDLRGVTVFEAKDINHSSYIHHLDLPVGSYVVEVQLANGIIQTEKIILR
jgi:hypothetical protein